MDMSKGVPQVRTTPNQMPRSIRAAAVRGLTSCRAGKTVPVFADVMLREDAVRSGQINVAISMAETVQPLMNGIHALLQVHFIPWLAFERFDGIDDFNRSYQKVPSKTGAVVPFFQTVAFDRNAEFWKTLGCHAVQGAQVNSQYLEGYIALINFLRRSRSDKIPDWPAGSTTLAPAFWRDNRFAHVLPDFDQAKMDGEVALQFVNQKLPIRGLARGAVAPAGSYNRTDGSNSSVPAADLRAAFADVGTVGSGMSVFAELMGSGVTVSLSNLDLARQTQAFAAIRESFNGKVTDDFIIDLLMAGVRVPDESLRQPVLLGQSATMLGYNERHATDGANLQKSVTTGMAELSVRFATPAMNTGGVIMATVQIVPEQMFERVQDLGLSITDVDLLPQADADFLDPEKAEIVPNAHIDVLHSAPAGIFGYAPLNHAWAMRQRTLIGGRFQRPVTNTFTEARQRLWAVEQVNPALNTDFFVVPNLPHTVFADTTADPFEIVTIGQIQYEGLTVIGPRLVEKSDDYAQVLSEVDTSRITQPA